MTLYEQHIGRRTTKADLIPEREFYVSLILTKEQMERRSKLGKKQQFKQTTLWDYLQQQ